MAVTDLVKVQIGQQADLETPAAATAILMGVTDAHLQVVSEEHHVAKSGWYYPSSHISQVAFSGEGSISMDLSYEDIIFPFDNFFDEEAPVGTVWTYTAPVDAQIDPNYYTIEFGDDGAGTAAEFEAAGCLFTELNIKGEAGGIWTGTFPFVCVDVDDLAMTGALGDRAVELIRMSDTDIHLDAWGTAAGTAAASADTLISFELHVEKNLHLKTFAGDMNPTAWGDGQWTGTLKTVLEHNAVSDALIDALLAPGLVQRAIEIEAIGPVSASFVTIHFYGTLVNGVKLFDDREGNVVVSLEWEGTYDPTQADWLEIIVDNGVAALP
jgi:hypothetical protein